ALHLDCLTCACFHSSVVEIRKSRKIVPPKRSIFLIAKRVDAAQISVVAKADITSFFDNLDTFRTRNQQLSANFCLLQCGNREQHHEHRLSKTSQQRPLFVNTGTPNEP
ncbi:hypothetical protein D6U63_15185, partial [Vibrio cholerae]|nr:hypothetical protein [Vibrio cholerae]